MKALFFAVMLLLVYTNVEGIVINLAYPNRLAFVGKDLYLVLLYLMFFGRNPRLFLSPPRSLRGVATGIWAVSLLIVVYSGASVLAGVIALKQWLMYFPLAIIGYVLAGVPGRVERLFALTLGASLPVIAFGLYQHVRGPAAFRDLGMGYAYIVYTAWVPGTESYWRIVGTFNSSVQFSFYLHMICCLATGYLLCRPSGGPWGLAWWVLGGSAIVMLATGTRTAFSMLCLALLLFLLLARRWSVRIGATLVVVGVMALAFLLVGGGAQGRFGTVASTEASERVASTITGQFLGHLVEDPVGKGAGLATISARYVVGRENIYLVESYLGKFALEMGVLGLSAVLWTFFRTAVLCWRATRLLNRTRLGALGHGIFVFLVTNLLTTPVTTALDSTPVNVYFWLFLGVLTGVAARVPRAGPVARPSAAMPPAALAAVS
jgi:hypothetical protein